MNIFLIIIKYLKKKSLIMNNVIILIKIFINLYIRYIDIISKIIN